MRSSTPESWYPTRYGSSLPYWSTGGKLSWKSWAFFLWFSFGFTPSSIQFFLILTDSWGFNPKWPLIHWGPLTASCSPKPVCRLLRREACERRTGWIPLWRNIELQPGFGRHYSPISWILLSESQKDIMASKKPKMETMGFSKTLGKYVCVAERNFPFCNWGSWICPSDAAHGGEPGGLGGHGGLGGAGVVLYLWIYHLFFLLILLGIATGWLYWKRRIWFGLQGTRH